MTPSKLIQWTPAVLARFKAAYEIEKHGGPDHVFRFDGSDFLVAYAGYLIEYLTIRFNGEDR